MNKYTLWFLMAFFIFTINCEAKTNSVVDVNAWVGVWEQTNLSNDTARPECKIIKLFKFQYQFEKGKDAKLEGFFIQSDYRYNVTIPPNPACEFNNTKTANVLLNVKRWKIKAEISEKDNSLRLIGYSGQCQQDLCRSPNESDFETVISMVDGNAVDNFGTPHIGDDVYLVSDLNRNLLITAAKKVALQVKDQLLKKNCSGLYDLFKKSNRHKLSDDYLKECKKNYKSLPEITAYIEADNFLSYNKSGLHWAVFLNEVIYKDETEKNELMYLVFEDNNWKLWRVY